MRHSANQAAHAVAREAVFMSGCGVWMSRGFLLMYS